MLVGLLFMFMNLTIGIFCFFCFTFLETKKVYMIEYLFNLSNSLNLSYSMIFDWMSMFCLGLVCFISSIMFCEYMMDDKN